MPQEAESKRAEQVSWVPIFGEFEVQPDELSFHGKLVPTTDAGAGVEPQTVMRPGVGLVLSSVALADGVVSADVTFESVTPETLCEIAVAYDPNAGHILTAGLGGEGSTMFGIREYGGPRTGGKGWFAHRFAGERANLHPGTEYHLELHLRGASARLLLDGVSVAMVDVTSPKGRPRHAGIFCRGNHKISVRRFRTQSDKPRAFVVMQFTADFDDVYRDVVKEVCRDYEVNVLRADEVSGPGLVIADIVREIGTAQLVIADITPTNPNVYFEVGYALALGKPTILLARKGTPLPFDVAGFRVQFYEDTIGGKKRLEDGLRRHLDAILES